MKYIYIYNYKEISRVGSATKIERTKIEGIGYHLGFSKVNGDRIGEVYIVRTLGM